jgi:hypothetical protein
MDNPETRAMMGASTERRQTKQKTQHNKQNRSANSGVNTCVREGCAVHVAYMTPAV